MKTMNVSKQMVWWQTASNLEVWECVMLKDVKKDVTPLASASEQRSAVALASPSSSTRLETEAGGNIAAKRR